MVLEWCKGKKRSCYYFVANQLCRAERVDSHNRGIAFAWADRHMWLYDGTSWCANAASRGVRAPAAVKLPCSKMADIPPADTWGELQDVKAGYYGSHDLEATREWLYEKGVVAKPSLDHRGKIVRLRVACVHQSSRHASRPGRGPLRLPVRCPRSRRRSRSALRDAKAT